MANLTSATTLGDRFDRAVIYALHIHAAQRRKKSGVPYSAHLLGVCAIALEFGADETEAIAALLHDAVEDCGGREQLEAVGVRFGQDVATIVEGCTDSFDDGDGPKLPWYDRKIQYISKLAEHANERESESTLLVSASDKLYNALAIYNDYQRAGERVFDRFNAKRFGTLWYYRSLADIFVQTTGRSQEIGVRISAIVDSLAGRSIPLADLLASFAADPTVEEREKGSLLKRPAVTVA